MAKRKIQKQYTVTVIVDDKDELSFERVNDGFNAFELLGIVEWLKNDMVKIMEGSIKPDVVKRTVITD